MLEQGRSPSVAHVSIAAPRDLLASGQQRVDVFLHEDGDESQAGTSCMPLARLY